jgi:hypothetical protein
VAHVGQHVARGYHSQPAGQLHQLLHRENVRKPDNCRNFVENLSESRSEFSPISGSRRAEITNCTEKKMLFKAPVQ